MVDSTGLFTLKKKTEYRCVQNHTADNRSCAERQKDDESLCHGCVFTAACRKARALPSRVQNYHSYMANKLYSSILIADEAHLLLRMLRDLSSKKLWYRDYKFPHNVRTYEQLLIWARERHESMPADKKLKTLLGDLESGRNHYLVEKGEDLLYGKKESLLRLLPIDTSASPPILWPNGKVDKIILLSATIGMKDVEQMGLANRRLSWISVPSPILPWRRPVIADSVSTLSYGASEDNFERLGAYCNEIVQMFKGYNGLIHLPYSLADKMQFYLQDERYIFHNSMNKMEKFREFTESTDKVLVCSGLYEGIDLPGDAGRFQIIGKIPWPSLADPAMKYLAETDRERYQWDTLRTVVQAAGRICRLVDDVGYTFCPDKSFERLPPGLFPGYFKDAVDAGENWKRNNPEPFDRLGKAKFYIEERV